MISRGEFTLESLVSPRVAFKGRLLRPLQPEREVGSGLRMLPISINGILSNAVPDTVSNDNLIPEDYARSIGAALNRRVATELYLNSCERKFISVWTTSLPCSFPNEAQSSRISVFSVVFKLSVPVIIGSEILQTTQTLTKFKHRLAKLAGKTFTKWRVLQTQITRRRMSYTLDGKRVLANADTGPNIELISLGYTLQRNLHVEQIHKWSSKVELANGSTTQLTGKVVCTFEIGSEDSRNREFRIFYVLPGLTSEVLLGDQQLAHHQVFELDEHDFVVKDDISPNSVDPIYWAGSKGWPSLSSMLNDAKTGTLKPVDSAPQSTTIRLAIRTGFKGEPKI